MAHAMKRCANVRQILIEIDDQAFDTPQNISVICGSESVLVIQQNNRDTKRTRQIQRRIHYERDDFLLVSIMDSKLVAL